MSLSWHIFQEGSIGRHMPLNALLRILDIHCHLGLSLSKEYIPCNITSKTGNQTLQKETLKLKINIQLRLGDLCRWCRPAGLENHLGKMSWLPVTEGEQNKPFVDSLPKCFKHPRGSFSQNVVDLSLMY